MIYSYQLCDCFHFTELIFLNSIHVLKISFMAFLSSEEPNHVLGGTKDVSVATIYRACFSRSRLKFWRFYVLFLFFVLKFTMFYILLSFAESIYWWYKGCISCYNLQNMIWFFKT
ncbi:hypothetical protein BpHYR1_018252 [Brachionus plicatilis]|uniref:Uncharacterized protein n=1 Tax=Brachionus plicatilis TaxID=10195 RepID=A0A3M7PX33_BRAPC|nr:hypothetical protein BpHYR1_018252 [Brachionus plicatilis]